MSKKKQLKISKKSLDKIMQQPGIITEINVAMNIHELLKEKFDKINIKTHK